MGLNWRLKKKQHNYLVEKTLKKTGVNPQIRSSNNYVGVIGLRYKDNVYIFLINACTSSPEAKVEISNSDKENSYTSGKFKLDPMQVRTFFKKTN